jgi:hypothetical protein
MGASLRARVCHPWILSLTEATTEGARSALDDQRRHSPDRHTFTAGLSIAGRERTQPDDTDSNPTLTFRVEHQVGRRERSRVSFHLHPACIAGMIFQTPSRRARHTHLPDRKAVALFNRTSHALGATARGSRRTHQYDCPLGLDIDTCARLVERQADAPRPHVSPINSACEPQGQAVDV